jgi:Zn-dependent membrane protease YugP
MVQAGHETAGVNRVLNAAALTYVAAFIATLGNLIYLFIARDRRD